MPSSRSFLEFMQYLLHFLNHIQIVWLLEPIQLFNVYLFFNFAIQKIQFGIHLYKHKKHPYSFHSFYRSKCILKIYAFNLWITFANQPFLISSDFSIFIQLVLKHPLGSYHIFDQWSKHQLPCFILSYLIQLFFHFFYLNLIFIGFHIGLCLYLR